MALILLPFLLAGVAIPVDKGNFRFAARCGLRQTCVECIAGHCGWDVVAMACVDIPVAAGTSGRLATNQCAQDSDALANPEWRDRPESKSNKPTVDKSIFTLTPKIDFPASLNQLPEEAVDVNQNLRLQPAGLSVLRNMAKSNSNFPSSSILEKSASSAPGYTNPAVLEPSLTNRLGWEESHVREELADTIVRAAQRPTAVERAVVGETIEAEEMGHDTFSSATSKQNSNMKKFGITSVNIVPSASLANTKGVDAFSSNLPPVDPSAHHSKKGALKTFVGDQMSAKAVNRAKAVVRQAREEVKNELAVSGSATDPVDLKEALAMKKDLAAISVHHKPKHSDKEYIRLTKAVGKPGLVDRVEQEDIMDSLMQGEKFAKDATSAKVQQATHDILSSPSKFPPNLETEQEGNTELGRKLKAALTGGSAAAAVESFSKATNALQRLVGAAAAKANAVSPGSGSGVPSTESGGGSGSAGSEIFITTTTFSPPTSTTVSPLNNIRAMLKPEGMHGSGSGGSSSGSGGNADKVLKPFVRDTELGSGSAGSAGSGASSGLLKDVSSTTTTSNPFATTPVPLGSGSGSGSVSGPVVSPASGSSESSSLSPLGNTVPKDLSFGSGSGSNAGGTTLGNHLGGGGSSASGSLGKIGSGSGSASGSSPIPPLPTPSTKPLLPSDLFSSSTGPASY